jgi:hypothetical protein
MRGGSRADKRFGHFASRCVTAALVMLYLTYPSVSQVIVNMLSCQRVDTSNDDDVAAVYYLRADFRIMCYTVRHRTHMAAAGFWICVFPVGVPLLFWAALWYYGVPRMAADKADTAWLAAACDHAARHARLQPPPDVDARTLTTASISDTYLEALHDLFCEVDNCSDEEETTVLPCAGAAQLLQCSSQRRMAPSLTREARLAALLRWCRTCGHLAPAPPRWALTSGRLAEEGEEGGGKKTRFASTAPPLPPTAEEVLAEDRVGFLFEAYRVECYYWEIVELLRKFLLTSVMSMVSPGSAAQVVMGLLVAFAAVVLYSRVSPYEDASNNSLGFFAQLNLARIWLAALLVRCCPSEHHSHRMHSDTSADTYYCMFVCSDRTLARSHNPLFAVLLPACGAAAQGAGRPGRRRLVPLQRCRGCAVPLRLHRAAREQSHLDVLRRRRCWLLISTMVHVNPSALTHSACGDTRAPQSVTSTQRSAPPASAAPASSVQSPARAQPLAGARSKSRQTSALPLRTAHQERHTSGQRRRASTGSAPKMRATHDGGSMRASVGCTASPERCGSNDSHVTAQPRAGSRHAVGAARRRASSGSARASVPPPCPLRGSHASCASDALAGSTTARRKCGTEEAPSSSGSTGAGVYRKWVQAPPRRRAVNIQSGRRVAAFICVMRSVRQSFSANALVLAAQRLDNVGSPRDFARFRV